jgi:hypothetical protein
VTTLRDRHGALGPLVAAHDALVAAAAALPEAALEARVAWGDGEQPIGWLLLRAGAHETEHRLSIEQALERLGWRRAAAIGHLGDAPASRRRVEALLVGVPEALLDRAPAPGEWTVRRSVEHLMAVDRRYSLQTLHAAMRSDDDPLRPADDALPERIPEPVAGEPLAALIARLRATFDAALDPLFALTDAQLTRPTDWAGSRQEVAFRLHRFAEHYDEHADDVAAALDALGFARSLPARIAATRAAQFGALEGALLGVPAALVDAAAAGGGWTIREQLAHLADENARLLDRVREVTE